MDPSCIPANPDIAGIGVRAALYAQAILVFIPIALLPFTPNPVTGNSSSGLARKLFDDVSVNVATVYVTGIALLIATFIQAQLSDFDLYHGIVVLNLSWLNVLTIFMPVFVATLSKQREANRQNQDFEISFEYPAFAFYFAVVGAYGIWLSYRLANFGSFPDCNSLTVWVLAGRSVPATTPGLRAFLLTISSMAAFPIVNFGLLLLATMVAVGLFWLVVISMVGLAQIVLRVDLVVFRLLLENGPEDLMFTISYFVTTITSTVIIITSTEQLIAFNKPIVGPGENDWTFGQTLALLLLAPSLWQVVVRMATAMGGSDHTTTLGNEEGRDEATTTRAETTALEPGHGTAVEEQTSADEKQSAALTQRHNVQGLSSTEVAAE